MNVDMFYVFCVVLYNYNYILYLLEDALILVFEIQTLILHCYYSVLKFISTECVAMNYSNKRLVFIVSVHSILNLKTLLPLPNNSLHFMPPETFEALISF